MFAWSQVFVVEKVLGFVEELVVENDPEFEWRDMIRQHRSSNESRQTLLYKLDATVRRQLGKKVRTRSTLAEHNCCLRAGSRGLV